MRWSTRAVATLMVCASAAACASSEDGEPDIVPLVQGFGGMTATGGNKPTGGRPETAGFPGSAASPGTSGFPSASGSAGAPAGGSAAGPAGSGGAPTAGSANAGAETGGKPTGPCNGVPDGTPCGPTGDACNHGAVCKGGECVKGGPKPNGTVCADAPNPCVNASTCQNGTCVPGDSKPASHNWDPSDPWARCCEGKPVKTTTDNHCGGCGIKCNPSNGESCQARSNLGHTQYYCAGCIASAKCWSGCCSLSYSATKNVCSASDCKGNCGDKCPAGMHCVSGAQFQMSNWCAWD